MFTSGPKNKFITRKKKVSFYFLYMGIFSDISLLMKSNAQLKWKEIRLHLVLIDAYFMKVFVCKSILSVLWKKKLKFCWNHFYKFKKNTKSYKQVIDLNYSVCGTYFKVASEFVNLQSEHGVVLLELFGIDMVSDLRNVFLGVFCCALFCFLENTVK